MNATKVYQFALGPTASAALGLLILPLLTRVFSQADLGRFGMLQVACSLGTLLFSLGLDQAYVREYHEEAVKPALLKHVLVPSLSFYCAFALLVAVGAIPLAEFLFGVTRGGLTLLALAALLTALLANFFRLTLRMEERALSYSASQFFPRGFFLAMVLLALLFRPAPSLGLLLSMFVASSAAVLGWLLWANRNELAQAFEEQIRAPKLLAMLKFGAPLVVAGIAYWGLNATDRVSLRFFAAFSELGLYSITSSVASGGALLGAVFSTVWAPTVYKWAAEKQDMAKVDRVIHYMLAAVILVFCLVGLFSFAVAWIFPEEYAVMRFLLVPCLAGPLLYALSETTAVGLGLSRRSHLSMIASAAAFLANLIGNLLLVPRFGAAGAAAATAVAFWLFLLLRTEFSCRAWRRLPRRGLYTGSGICVAGACLTALLGPLIGPLNEVLWVVGLALAVGFFRTTYREGLAWALSHIRP